MTPTVEQTKVILATDDGGCFEGGFKGLTEGVYYNHHPLDHPRAMVTKSTPPPGPPTSLVSYCRSTTDKGYRDEY